MQIPLGQTAGHAHEILGRPFRITGPAKVLGGILFLYLLFNSVQAFSLPVPAGQSATLAWNPSLATNAAGYNIYYGATSGTYNSKINVGNATTVTISGLVPGVTYYFAATTYDSNGEESGFSNEASYVVPTPGALQIRSAPAGQFILTVTGLTGQTYLILATQDFLAWTVIGIVTFDNGGSLDFTDTRAASFQRRFYRTRKIP